MLWLVPVFFIFSGQSDAGNKKFRAAPINAQYQEYVKNWKAGVLQKFSDDGHPLGLIPSIHDLSYIKTEGIYRTYDLPDSYDLRTLNKLTSVKNQGSCGSCWAFASYGSLESYLMPNENRNFSEQNLVDHHGFDWGPCEGGSIDMATAYLARWDGPINESEDPYIHALSMNLLDIKKHVQNVIYFYPKSSAADNDRIKQAVMNYGGIYTTMYYSAAYYNSANKSYYNPSERVGAHAVVIVGWDNNFDQYKFNQVPPGNGVFIVKNSWGSGWGESGYFYVSYYDAFFGRRDLCAAVTAEPTSTYQDIYQYDPFGWVWSLGYEDTNTAWGANIFTAKSSLPLSAVSFYCAGRSNRYEIYVYTGVSAEGPRTGVLAAAKSGSTDNPGYYTIPMDSMVPLYAGQKFSVVIKFITEGYNFPVPVEYPYPDYCSQASANSGESFISEDGNVWDDMLTANEGEYANTNICIKALAGYPGIYPPENFSLQRLENNLIFSKEYINRLEWTPNPKNVTQIVKYKIFRKKKNQNELYYQLLTELAATELSYEDRGLKKTDLYTYGILCVDEWNRESDLTEISNEGE
ncbi:MAG: lectin like domain-containing protein [Candidatus Aminicenantales bacterium]